MGKRFIFRADAGPVMGFGHFVRSVALAGYVREADPEAEILFASRFDSGVASLFPFQRDALNEIDASFFPLADNTDFLSIPGKDDVTVLDNYYYTPDYQKEVRARCRALVAIHDMAGYEFEADAVISGTPLPRTAYRIPDYSLYFSGLEYFPLRKPFFSSFHRREISAAGPDCCEAPIVMAMGGADPLHLAPRLVGAVRRAFKDSPVVVVGRHPLPPDVGNVSTLSGLTAEQMVDLFDSACLGIFPASTVCIEALSRRLPVVSGRFVDNQDILLDALKGGGYARSVGDLARLADMEVEAAAEVIRKAGVAAMASSGNSIPFLKGKSVLTEMLLNF